MKHCIWILSAKMALHSKGAGGVSSTYILPKSHIQIDPAELVGGRIWIILRSAQGDALFSCIHVDMVEQFEDGLNAGDFLLTINLTKSYRCFAAYDSGGANFHTNKTSSLPDGLNVSDAAAFAALSAQAASTIATKLQKPSSTVWEKTSARYFRKAGFANAETALAAVTGSFALEDVWAGGKPRLPPFANFACHALLSIHGKNVSDRLMGDLSRLDPTIFQAATPRITDALDGSSRKPIVDTNLLPIDPDRIFARKFIARCQNPIDLVDIAGKMEHAEKKHQDMLRDIATRLRTMNFLPLQSSSLDLFVPTGDGFSLFEIKTATPKNILSQAAKGVFQLGCYKNALQEKGYCNCSLAIVMEAIGVSELESYVFDILHSFGMHVLFYDVAKPWPDRLKGLESLIGSFDGK